MTSFLGSPSSPATPYRLLTRPAVMSRRGVGLGAFVNRNQTTQSYATHGANLRSTHLASLQTQLSVFQSLLHTFALEHSSTIKSNPTFRAEFARMCNTIGVDPLAASNIKGKNGRRGLGEGGSFWTQILGGDMNDFYFEVAVRVVELCRETRSENGGLLGVEECRTRVGKGKAIGSGLEVSEYGGHLLSGLYVILIWLTRLFARIGMTSCALFAPLNLSLPDSPSSALAPSNTSAQSPRSLIPTKLRFLKRYKC